MPDEAVRMTRKELYKQVWEQPMSRLAQQFGISDVALAKKCRKLRIPVPGRGYWRKLEVGQKVRRASLPSGRDSEEHTIVIEGVREWVLLAHEVADELDPFVDAKATTSG